MSQRPETTINRFSRITKNDVLNTMKTKIMNRQNSHTEIKNLNRAARATFHSFGSERRVQQQVSNIENAQQKLRIKTFSYMIRDTNA